MKVTFLIGNGFDINCGLKCTYKDVYAGYCKTESNSEIIAKFKEEINGNLDTWADFEMAMNDYMRTFKSEKDFLLCARDFKTYMIDHLKREETGFISNQITQLIRNREYLISKEANRSLMSFYKGISHDVDYLFEETDLASTKIYQFVTFNYTKVTDYVIEQAVSGPEIIHIHGMLDDDPTIGIDNKDQLHKELQFQPSISTFREFIKPYFNQEYDNNRVKRAITAIRSSDTICSFGMSLGDSDLTWRNHVIAWLEKDPSHQLFIYDYKCSCRKTNIVTQRMDEEDEEKRLFLYRIGYHNDGSRSIFNQIHIPIGRNLFNIKQILNEALKEIVRANAEAKEKAEDNRKRSIGSMRGSGA